MIVFPQLTTGASALYPVRKAHVARTIYNALPGGSAIAAADSDAAFDEWELHATGLTRAEWNAMESLFQQTTGPLGTFLFLDPAGNLLLHSEEFDGSGWTRGALIQATPAVADPLGTTRAVRLVNAGQAAASVAQTLAVPGNFTYCLSVWARTVAGSPLRLEFGNAGRTFAVDSQWRRFTVSANAGVSAETVTFGVSLDAGASVEVFGAQAEAQMGASDYKKTGASGGAYPNARFAADELTATARGTDVYDAVIRIVNTGS